MVWASHLPGAAMVWKLLNLHTLFDRLLADLFDDGWMSPLSLADADCHDTGHIA